jgi:hypothetical protein
VPLLSLRRALMILRGSHPIALAFLLCGTFYFYLMADWFEVLHPAWYVWGWLALSTVSHAQRCWQVVRSQLMLIDWAIAGFVTVVLTSAAMQSGQDLARALQLLSTYLVLPYTAARVLDREEIRLLLKTCALLGFVAIPLSIIELTSLDATELADDRIKSFLGAYYTLNETGMLLGTYLVIAATTMLAFEKKMVVGLRIFFFLSIAVCSAVMTVLGARGGLFVSLAVCGMILLLPWGVSARYRAVILAAMVIPVLVSFVNVSDARKGFYAELLGPLMRLGQNPLTAQSAQGAPMRPGQNPLTATQLLAGEQNVEGRRAGVSPGVRSLLIRDAMNSFLSNPVLGVGFGNFGNYSPTVKASSENSFCYRGSSREGNVQSYRCVQPVRYAHPHSSALHILSELGLVGIGIYGMVLGACLGLLWKCAQRHKTLGSARLVAMLGILWLFYLGLDQIYGSYFSGFRFYLLTGCVAALVGTARCHLERSS